MKIPQAVQVLLAAVCLSGAIATVAVFGGGCSTNSTTTAYKAEVGTDAGVKTALVGWNVYVGMYHPGTNAEMKVLNSFKLVQAAELTVVDATASLDQNPTNTAPLQAAENALAASQADFVVLVRSLTNAIPSK